MVPKLFGTRDQFRRRHFFFSTDQGLERWFWDDSSTWHLLCTLFLLLWHELHHRSVQFSSDTESCLTLCDPMNHSTPGLLVLHYLPEFAQTYVHWVSDAIQTSHPLSPSSPLALNLSQHQGLFQWVSSWHQVAKVLELQHQSFQWVFTADFL